MRTTKFPAFLSHMMCCTITWSKIAQKIFHDSTYSTQHYTTLSLDPRLVLAVYMCICFCMYVICWWAVISVVKGKCTMSIKLFASTWQQSAWAFVELAAMLVCWEYGCGCRKGNVGMMSIIIRSDCTHRYYVSSSRLSGSMNNISRWRGGWKLGGDGAVYCGCTWGCERCVVRLCACGLQASLLPAP